MGTGSRGKKDVKDAPVYKGLLKRAEELDDKTQGDEVSNALDELVISAVLKDAALVNNGGYVNQLSFLVERGLGWDAATMLRGLAEELGVPFGDGGAKEVPGEGAAGCSGPAPDSLE